MAAFAAGVGGADALTVVPFDEPIGLPDTFGRRIARNTSSLLIEESHVATVTDPAGGSYAVEKLTDDLAIAGWAELARIEGDGGALADDARAGVKERVKAVAEARDAQVADRSRPLTGVSEFPTSTRCCPSATRPAPLRPALRLRLRRHAGGARRAARVPGHAGSRLRAHGPGHFATNLLAAGGVAVEAAGADRRGGGGHAAYAGQPVVCLAGTDAAYAEWGPSRSPRCGRQGRRTSCWRAGRGRRP